MVYKILIKHFGGVFQIPDLVLLTETTYLPNVWAHSFSFKREKTDLNLDYSLVSKSLQIS